MDEALCALPKPARRADLATYPEYLRLLDLTKGRRDLMARMNNQTLGNYLRTHRRKSGLSQRELGSILGYVNEGQVGRHERSKTVPPLIAALTYEVVFQVAVTELFPGLHEEVTRMTEGNLEAFEAELQQRSGKGRGANETAQKLVWLKQRRVP